MNGYIEQINGDKYLTLDPTIESKEIKKKYEELWSEIRNLIRSLTNNSEGYNKK